MLRREQRCPLSRVTSNALEVAVATQNLLGHAWGEQREHVSCSETSVIARYSLCYSTQDLLGLSGEQREQILAHRHIKLVSLARLVQERRELQVKLQVGAHPL